MNVPDFIRALAVADLPDDVVASARRSLLDLIGIAASGSRTRAAQIAASYAATQLGGSDRSARILFDGRRAGVAGAAFAGATAIDALDGHDGHVLTKGHAGAALLPALLALIDGAKPGEAAGEVDGRELLVCLVLGYEVATRAGIALHATVADYHCSGAWNALGCAAIATVAVESFREAVALGSQCAMPRTTEEAQYSLSFPVAAALVFGRIGADEVRETGLGNPAVARLVGATMAVEDIEFSRCFPAERWARVRIALKDGRTFVSHAEQARGGPENPLSDTELEQKYRSLAEPVLGAKRSQRIEDAVGALADDLRRVPGLLEDVLQPPV